MRDRCGKNTSRQCTIGAPHKVLELCWALLPLLQPTDQVIQSVKHPCAILALALLWPLQHFAIAKISVYADGSFSDSGAGWALIVIVTHYDGTTACLGSLRGRLTPQQKLVALCNLPLTNNVAEAFGAFFLKTCGPHCCGQEMATRRY